MFQNQIITNSISKLYDVTLCELLDSRKKKTSKLWNWLFLFQVKLTRLSSFRLATYFQQINYGLLYIYVPWIKFLYSNVIFPLHIHQL